MYACIEYIYIFVENLHISSEKSKNDKNDHS